MTASMVERSPQWLARVAGLWYLALAIFGGFGIAFADAHFVVEGNPVATAGLIQGGEALFRLTILANLVGQTCFLFVGLTFFRLFEPFDKTQARVLLVLVIASVPIAFVNMLNKFAALTLLGNPPYLQAMDPSQLRSLAMVFLDLQTYGTLIASVFWGLWLLPLGLLVFRTRLFPRILGVLLVINGLTYLVDSFLGMWNPAVRASLAPVMGYLLAIGEIPFLLWLLTMGAKTPKPAAA